MATNEVRPTSSQAYRANWMQHPVVRRITMALIALTAVMGMAVASPGAASAAPAIPQSPAIVHVDMPMAPRGNDWAAQTARFAGCLGGFGVAAGPIVVGFMFGGPGGAVNAAKAWFPKLGPVGTNTLKWCMRSVLGVRV